MNAPKIPRITQAGQLHRRLLQLENFDFRPNGRDLALYRHIKASLNLPEGEFLKALDAAEVSAGAYLRTLMQAAEPFSRMYRRLLDYCERSGTRRSTSGAHVEWSMGIDAKQVPFSLEHLRIYKEVESHVQPDLKRWGSAKNDVMDWLSKHALPETAYRAIYPYDWDEVEMFRILRDARDRVPGDPKNIFAGLDRVYLKPDQGRPPRKLVDRVEQHPDYTEMLRMVRSTFGGTSIESLATEFISLPMWRFRWEIYELWVLCTVLEQLEPVGFKLRPSPDGGSLLELGSESTVACDLAGSTCVVYQPAYSLDGGDEVKPDVVVTQAVPVSSNDVGLIVEAKQREAIAKGHIADVAERYSRAVSGGSGEVIIVNYDSVGGRETTLPKNVTVIGDVVPDSAGERALLQQIARSAVVRLRREEIWYVDISLSMRPFLTPTVREHLSQRPGFASSLTLFSFASQVAEVQVAKLDATAALSSSPDDPEWEGHGIEDLCRHLEHQRTMNPNARLYVLTDLAQASGQWGDLEERLGPGVCVLHPESADLSVADPH